MSESVNHEPPEDWKAALRAQLNAWVDELPDDPLDSDEGDDDVDGPDWASLLGELAALRAEFKAGNRKSAATAVRTEEALGSFAQEAAGLRETASQLVAASRDSGLGEAGAVRLAQLGDRIDRLAQALAKPPARPARRSFWRRATSDSEETMKNLRQAVDILQHHYCGLLEHESVERRSATGKDFDPQWMLAGGARSDPGAPLRSVLETTASAVLLRGRLLAPAEVIINSTDDSPSQ